MTMLSWDTRKKRYFESGVSHGILFPSIGNNAYGSGIVWNGLTKVNETSSGGDENAIYADNGKYVALMGTDEFEFTIEAYQCPKEFEECTGVNSFNGMYFGQQKRKRFGFSYTTLIGNDEDGLEHGEKIHLVYGAATKSSDKDYETVNDSPDAMTMSWECTTTPITVPGFKPTAHLVLDSRKIDSRVFALLKEQIYGSNGSSPTLLMPDQVSRFINFRLISAKAFPIALNNRYVQIPRYSTAYDVYDSQSLKSDVLVNDDRIEGAVDESNVEGHPHLLVINFGWTTLGDCGWQPSATIHWTRKRSSTDSPLVYVGDLIGIEPFDYAMQGPVVYPDDDQDTLPFEYRYTVAADLSEIFNYVVEDERMNALAVTNAYIEFVFRHNGKTVYEKHYSLADVKGESITFVPVYPDEPEG